MPGRRSRNSSENSYESSDEDFLDPGKWKSTGESSNHSNGESNDQQCRRGRAPSKRPCLNKNALMARQNRLKKKEYVEGIENELKNYRHQNQKQFDFIQKQNIQLKQLSAENAYLRSVLKNKTAITSLLTSMNTILSKEKLENVRQCNGNEYKMATSKIEPAESEISHPSNTNAVPSNEEFDPKNLSNIQGKNDINAEHSPSQSLCDLDPLELEADGDLFRNDSLKAGNLFENLGDSGVCFHVNSNKVSMEFCTVCHLNSVNSDEAI